MQREETKYEKKNGVAYLSMSRPDKGNAVTRKMVGELREGIMDVRNDPEVKVLVFKGEGRFFSAGIDLDECAKGEDLMRDVPGTALPAVAGGLDILLRDCDKITIAAVNGPAIGMSCDLALCCDFRICSDKASFWEPYARLGTMPSAGPYFLPKMVGIQKAMAFFLLGETISADEALKLGIAYKVVPGDKLNAAVQEVIDVLMQYSPTVLQFTKHTILMGLENTLANVLDYVKWTRKITRPLIAPAAQAILEKKSPTYKY